MSEHQRIAHDVCWSSARALTRTVGGRLTDEERQALFIEIFQTLRNVITIYEIQMDRRRRRLGEPDPN